MNERRALWIYPWDILDAGIDETVRRARDEWGLTSLSLAASYHSAKFLLPRRSERKVFLTGGSAVYFRPDDTAYAGTSLRPVVAPDDSLLDVLDQTADACQRHGLTLRAWTVGLHNSRLGETAPRVVSENVFGDRFIWALCPANPEVRRYVIGLLRDLATNHALDAIDLESVGYHGLAHGHHHELIGISYGPVEEMLLSLCFCESCRQRAGEAGIDADALRAEVRAFLEARFRDEATIPAPDPADMRSLLALLMVWPALYGYIQMRLETVTSLVAEIKAKALEGTATQLALTASTFVSPVANAWLEGMDLRALAQAADELIVLSYFHDPGEIAADLRLSGELTGSMECLVAGLSLLHPRTTSGENLRAKVDAARALGITKFSFYNFGFVSEARLGWLAGL